MLVLFRLDLGRIVESRVETLAEDSLADTFVLSGIGCSLVAHVRTDGRRLVAVGWCSRRVHGIAGPTAIVRRLFHAFDSGETDGFVAVGEGRTNPDGTWNFAAVDALYSDLLHRNLTPLFMPASPRSAADMGEITAYLVVAAGRYPKAMLELGNEPDSPVEWAAFYPPNRANPITPAEYWGYAEQWAKAWASSQPSAQIATAGTSGVDLTWQQGLVAAGAANSGLISAFGVHPYAENIVEPPGVTGNNLGDDLTSLKAMLPANVSVWLTEYGEPNPPPADVTAWLTAAKALGVPVFSWYELRDGEGPYGLLNADLSRKAPDPYKAAQQFLLGP